MVLSVHNTMILLFKGGVLQEKNKQTQTCIVKKATFYWCEAILSQVRAKKGLKTIGALKQTTVATSGWGLQLRVGVASHPRSEGFHKKQLKNKTHHLTSFTSTLQQNQNFLRGGVVHLCVCAPTELGQGV